MKPYLSDNTRHKAMMALEDLDTDVLLGHMRQMPLNSYRKKELDEALAKDMAEHAKVFRRAPEERPAKAKDEIDPARLLSAMAYAKAPEGEKGGAKPGLRVRPDQRAPDQGDPLGPMRVKKPQAPDDQLAIFDGMRVDGGGEATSDNDGGSNNAAR